MMGLQEAGALLLGVTVYHVATINARLRMEQDPPGHDERPAWRAHMEALRERSRIANAAGFALALWIGAEIGARWLP